MVVLLEDLLILEYWRGLASLVDLTLPKTGFINGKKIIDLLRTIMGGDIKFTDLMIPLVCVAADIFTCQEVVIKEGSVPEGIRASISIPAIFTLVRWKGRYLVDGSGEPGASECP